MEKKVKTNYFAILDADSTVDKSSLKFLFKEFFLKHSDCEKIAAVISKMYIEKNKSLVNRIQRFMYYFSGFSRFCYSKNQLLYMTPGVLSLYKKKTAKQVGYFDKENITEDFEIAFSLKGEGYKIVYCEKSKVKTNPPETWTSFLKQQIRWTRGFIQTNKKHRKFIFNKDFGFWGLFAIPLSIISQILLIFLFSSLIVNLSKKIYEKTLFLIYNPSFLNGLFDFEIKQVLLNLDLFITLPILFGFLYVFILVKESQKIFSNKFFSEEKFKNFLAFFVYIFIFGFFYAYILFVSIFKEIKGERKTWGTK